MIIDVHNHIGSDSKDNKHQSIEELKRNMKRYGISKAVIFPFSRKNDLTGASRRLLAYKSSSIIPFLRFNPRVDSVTEVEKELENGEFAGVKLHPKSQDFDPLDRRYFEFYKIIQKKRIPLLFHSKKENNKNTDPDRISKLAPKFPRLNIILGHYASMSRDTFMYAKSHNNLYIETSIFSSSGTFDTILKISNPNNILFGSDSPYSDMEIELMKVRKSELTKSQKEKILYDNAARLLDL